MEEEEESLTKAQRDAIDTSDFAWPEERKFPINSQAHLDSAATLIGHAPESMQAKIKARAISIAKRKGFSLPDAWKASQEAWVQPPTHKGRIASLKTCFLEDGATSLNGRQYPKEAVDRLIQSAQNTLSNPSARILASYVSHSRADEDDSTKLVGKVTKVWREGAKAMAQIDIADTTSGRDLASLIKGGYIQTMSLRASGAQLRLDQNNPLPQVGGNTLQLEGIDFTATPGIQQARIFDLTSESANPSPNEHSLREVFDLASSPLHLEEETQQNDKQETTMPVDEQDKKQTLQEAPNLPNLVSGDSVSTDGTATRSDYSNRTFTVPTLTHDPNSGGELPSVHDHIASVLGMSCAPSRESDRGKEIAMFAASEAGKAISKANVSHLTAAHDAVARTLGMSCEGSQPGAGVQQDRDMENTQMDKKQEAAAPQLTHEQAKALLEAAGYSVQRPKTQMELLEEQMNARLNEQQAANEARLKEMEEQFTARANALIPQNVAAPAQRKSQVVGANTDNQTQSNRPYRHGSYLREKISNTDWASLADRSAPLPEGLDPEVLLGEFEQLYAMQYCDRYGINPTTMLS